MNLVNLQCNYCFNMNENVKNFFYRVKVKDDKDIALSLPLCDKCVNRFYTGDNNDLYEIVFMGQEIHECCSGDLSVV